jgi:hypothetical protein
MKKAQISRASSSGSPYTAAVFTALLYALMTVPCAFAADTAAPPPVKNPPPVAPPTPAKTPAERAIEVVVYYQPQDSHWSDAQKVIDKVAATFKTAHFTRISTATPAGAAALKDFEEKNKIKEHGDLTVSVAGAIIVSTDDNRLVEKTLEYACTRAVAGLPAHKGKITANVNAYALEIFGKSVVTTFLERSEGDQDVEYFVVKKDGTTLGWVADAYYHIKCPVCNDTQFMAAVKFPNVMLLDLRPVRPLELRGVPIDAKKVGEFTAQFKNKTTKEGKDIDGISGATKTSEAYEKLVNELLDHLTQKQKKQDKADKEKREAELQKIKDTQKEKEKEKEKSKDASKD